MIFRRFLMLSLFALSGCGHVDLHQAELCQEAIRVLFAENRIAALSSVTAEHLAHGIVTTAKLVDRSGAVRTERVTCAFSSSGPKSEDQLALKDVETTSLGALDEAAIDRLHAALEAKGVYWKVSWIPTFGGPSGGQAPRELDVAALYFLQLVVNGMTYGSIFALVAIGFTLIYGAIGVVNLAFGDIYMVAAFVAVAGMLLMSALGIAPYALAAVAALPVTIAVAAGYSLLSDRLVFAKLRRSSPQMPLVASIGLSMVLQNFVFTSGGAKELWLTTPVARSLPLAQAGEFTLSISREQTLLFLGALAFIAGTTILLGRTAFGRQQRALSQDPRMAALLGVDIDRIIGGTFALAGGLAAGAGFMAASYVGSVSVTMGVMVGLKGFTAAIVGGIGSVRGAAIGGFLVALIESFTAGYFYGGFKEVAIFAVLILVMIFRPEGLLGEET